MSTTPSKAMTAEELWVEMVRIAGVINGKWQIIPLIDKQIKLAVEEAKKSAYDFFNYEKTYAEGFRAGELAMRERALDKAMQYGPSEGQVVKQIRSLTPTKGECGCKGNHRGDAVGKGCTKVDDSIKESEK